jgi:hypothetical protein
VPPARPHRASRFPPKPPTLDTLATTRITGRLQREKKHGCLSYLRRVVLGFDEVDLLAHSEPVTEELGKRTPTLPEFISSCKLSSVLVRRSLLRTLSAHGARRPSLLLLRKLSCACDGVSPESCTSLGTTPCEASSLGMCTSGARPNLISDFSPTPLYLRSQR